MDRLVAEIGDVPLLSRINFPGPRRNPKELVGNGILRRIALSPTANDLDGLLRDKITGRGGYTLAEVCDSAFLVIADGCNAFLFDLFFSTGCHHHFSPLGLGGLHL